MRDDYLWDRSGEPDPEIERLEHALQSLRHQPRPLELPALRPRRRLFHGLAAAAAVVLMALAAGMWLVVHRSNDASTHRLVIVRPTPDSLVGLYTTADSFAIKFKSEDAANRFLNAKSNGIPNTARRAREEKQNAPVLAKSRKRSDERMTREGEMATEQLMLALHFASSKLNLVQRKIQVNKQSGPAS
jgi:hypothetical protein